MPLWWKKVVGHIHYSGYHFHKYFGDIGYDNDKDFQGNNYAYRSLCLIGEILNENGIEDFWISARKDNMPSRKTIEK